VVESLKANPKIAIIILNWNGWRDTVECLESLRAASYDRFDTIIVDNASSDGSVEKIMDYLSRNKSPGLQIISCSLEEAKNAVKNEIDAEKALSGRKIIVIRNDENSGFAEGNNIGIRYTIRTLDPDYALLLNNDTVVDSHFLDRLIESAESDNRIAVLGPKIYYYDYKGKKDFVQSVGGYVNWFLYPGYHNIGGFEDSGEAEPSGFKERDYVSGAAMMIKAAHLREDTLDSTYFFGCEDVDFCLRVKKQGGVIANCEKSHIWHKVGVSRNKNPNLRTGKEVSVLFRHVIYNLRFTKKETRGYVIYIPIQIAHIGFKFLRKNLLRREYVPIFNRR